MDLREIIKWFIPCFHILLKLDARMMLLFLLLFCNLCPSLASDSELENSLNNTKNVSNYDLNSKFNQSEVYDGGLLLDIVDSKSEGTVGKFFMRTFKNAIPRELCISLSMSWRQLTTGMTTGFKCVILYSPSVRLLKHMKYVFFGLSHY